MVFEYFTTAKFENDPKIGEEGIVIKIQLIAETFPKLQIEILCLLHSGTTGKPSPCYVLLRQRTRSDQKPVRDETMLQKYWHKQWRVVSTALRTIHHFFICKNILVL